MRFLLLWLLVKLFFLQLIVVAGTISFFLESFGELSHRGTQIPSSVCHWKMQHFCWVAVCPFQSAMKVRSFLSLFLLSYSGQWELFVLNLILNSWFLLFHIKEKPSYCIQILKNACELWGFPEFHHITMCTKEWAVCSTEFSSIFLAFTCF